MSDHRKYGKPPFNVAVIHGGPGAAGELAIVAKEISKYSGVLEPLQTKSTVEKQLQELQTQLKIHTDAPITLIGHSWGAWLSLIFASRFSSMVNKLLLVGSATLDWKFTKGLTGTRLKRLSSSERADLNSLLIKLNDTHEMDKNTVFKQLAILLQKADTYLQINIDNEIIDYQYSIFQSVWAEAEQLRETGELLKIAEKINCPVVTIHGDYDSHPAAGVKKPLSGALKDFKFILLKKCGHSPWNEFWAKDKFYDILKKELEY